MCYMSWYYAYNEDEVVGFRKAMNILNSCLSAMCLMHVYWTYMFITMIKRSWGSGKTDDFHRNPNANKKS